MMREHAPLYTCCMPLGTPGDDGTGIRLGQGVGARTESMDECTAWRFLYPPEAFLHGVIVGTDGSRICDESLYGATLCKHIAARPDHRAWLVVDASLVERVAEEIRAEERLRDHSLAEILAGDTNALVFRKLNAALNVHLNRRRAETLPALERRCSLPAGSLERTVEAYNASIAAGEPDPAGKPDEYRSALVTGPFTAVNCDLDNRLFMGPCITLGGLAVDHGTGQVLREDGSRIPGLYAAGRTAVGVCSGGYVSGLSIADCVFSGRRAGRSAAGGGR
jgi:3-oxo-5alpha-steroid 4-dehydrogenase